MNVEHVLDSLNLDQIRTNLGTHYHLKGPGRKPFNPLSMLKAQLAKHLLQIPSDRRLALRLQRDRILARACGFRRWTPSHGGDLPARAYALAELRTRLLYTSEEVQSWQAIWRINPSRTENK